MKRFLKLLSRNQTAMVSCSSVVALNCCSVGSCVDHFYEDVVLVHVLKIKVRVGQGGSGIPVYPKKIAKIPQNSSKYTQNYTQVYFIGILYS